ncbi:hypothetical protein AWH56_010740 [Anaerobacillus isosaccharinicus]|uniref:Uncharacterized protein n=1 Tax=Anaerobacillus isosaccharinicus TaxID=1532552 RepID=A0A7S7LBH1_9BACI|nr:hypothetical protein [Anaerobacillus isosaccharinicus]MBA5588594.1 hypothetical protein [Anaerobacillus isosaccharinicus]QOY37993.1 hypothetical protein AWH56_010740 [Anaerobacillus isosaccharinicus]
MEDLFQYKTPKKRAKKKEVEVSLSERFKHPLIHREIHGDKIYTPLDPTRLWGI